jgi:hypothetical protein
MNVIEALDWINATRGVFIRRLDSGKYQAFLEAGFAADRLVPGQRMPEHPIGMTKGSWVEAVEDAHSRWKGY